MIYGFMGFTGLLIVLVIGHIFKNCVKNRQGYYNESKCQGSIDGCDPNQCEICQNVNNGF